MKIKSIHLKDFKRFTDLKIEGIPEKAKLVVMIGPNGSGKSSVFDAFNYYTYIIMNDSYPSDDAVVSPYVPMNMINYYLKNNVPRPIPNFPDNDISLDKLEDKIEASNTFLEDCKTLLSDCMKILLHSEQEMEKSELRVHTRSSLRNYSHLVHSDLYSTYSAKKLQLELDKPPTEKEEDHTFGLNNWVLNSYELLHRSPFQEIFGEQWPALPQELKNYAETVLDFKEDIISQVRDSIGQLFTDPVSKMIFDDILNLCLSMSDSELSRLSRVTATFYNLSVGEIAVFDLLLDIIIKRVLGDDVVICIDEPELHIHTKLQGQFLEELYNLIPDNSQLWIATHSIGMVRKAQDLWRDNPDAVVFLDFGNRNFDEPVTLTPTEPSPSFWEQTYDVALGDLAELVAPQRIVLCEGKIEEAEKGFDAACYNKIFASQYPETLFISIGAASDIKVADKKRIPLIEAIAGGIHTIRIRDKDILNEIQIKDGLKKGIRTLKRRDIENYLLANEVLIKLCENVDKSDKICELLTAKRNLKKDILNISSADDTPEDKLKCIAEDFYEQAKDILNIQSEYTSKKPERDFMKSELAPLIQPGMKVYEELHDTIFGE